MKEIKKLGAQGDVLFGRVKEIPASFVRVERGGKSLVVAHSETGHHHEIAEPSVEMFTDPRDPFVAYLQLGDGACDVVHLRAWDTHETLRLLGKPGDIWEVRRQREWSPEGWRRVED